MASPKYIKFFDTQGNDMNLGPTYSVVLTSLYDGSTSSPLSYEGNIYFPKVSLKLIESQQIFLLQEVTGPTSNYELRKVKGTAIVTGGNPTISGTDSDFSTLAVGMKISVAGVDFTVITPGTTASVQVSPTPSMSVTTGDIYVYDIKSNARKVE